MTIRYECVGKKSRNIPSDRKLVVEVPSAYSPNGWRKVELLSLEEGFRRDGLLYSHGESFRVRGGQVVATPERTDPPFLFGGTWDGPSDAPWRSKIVFIDPLTKVKTITHHRG